MVSIEERLKQAGVEDPRLCAKILREENLACEASVTALIDGEPIQYLVENWEFYGLPMRMKRGVLIARPDTEILVEKAIEFLKTRTNPTFIDLGCGSGAITVAVMKHTGAQGVALDQNPLALALTKENAEKNGVTPLIVERDMLCPPNGEFDAVISNPPYLTAQEMSELSPQVKKEPTEALFGGEDGLDFYRAIIPLYYKKIKSGGALLLEIGYQQGQAVAGLCREAGYTDIEILQDYSHNDRVVFCRRNEK